jgi:hypothetical protein
MWHAIGHTVPELDIMASNLSVDTLGKGTAQSQLAAAGNRIYRNLCAVAPKTEGKIIIAISKITGQIVNWGDILADAH